MSKLWPKVIRDPVHNIIPFERTPCDQLLLDLINTREFQRLRRIKQLGMSELVFPGANHSRFAHCIGVMHVARRMIDRLARLDGNKIREEQRTAVLVAALLHDIGHGPFSHAFEKVTGQSHEARTLEIIQNRDTEVGRRLHGHDRSLPERLAVFFDEDVEAEKRDAAEIPDYLTQIVASQLDADRFDYLLRDSYATGTDYGRYDLDWLLLQLLLDGKRLFVGRKAMDAAESYIFARFHMYRSVYFHKTVRAAEVMLRLALRRFKELLNMATSKAKRRKIAPDVPQRVIDAFSGALPIDAYLALDDVTLLDFFKACTYSTDKQLNMLARGLIERKLYKAIDVTDSSRTDVVQFARRGEEVVRRARLEPEYAFADDTAADTPYKPYDPDESRPASQIYVETGGGKNVEISTRSDALLQLRKRYELVRYYFSESIRERIEKVAGETLQKEDKR
ncbi:MAG: HD domain-containing protein [Phycisphaerae bacterium]|nr:HD domain-containing protein [Phycisphaerae bacterium]NUQ47962.1 HD domain-containing protein [Phycisphaerae bacterium]